MISLPRNVVGRRTEAEAAPGTTVGKLLGVWRAACVRAWGCDEGLCVGACMGVLRCVAPLNNPASIWTGSILAAWFQEAPILARGQSRGVWHAYRPWQQGERCCRGFGDACGCGWGRGGGVLTCGRCGECRRLGGSFGDQTTCVPTLASMGTRGFESWSIIWGKKNCIISPRWKAVCRAVCGQGARESWSKARTS